MQEAPYLKAAALLRRKAELWGIRPIHSLWEQV